MSKWSVLFERLMKQRGLGEDFLNPRYEDLEDPFLLPGMEAAVMRILEAGRKGEGVVIYGDYDVDGVTASVVMKEALEFAGVREVSILLPDRFVDGYGMNMGAREKILATGATLVVTVDCGSGSSEVIEALKSDEVDCIVTDHHEIPEVPEGAVAVVNPKVVAGGAGGALAGVGVAFGVARAVNARMNGGVCDGREKWLLDLVAIGTICDAMVLTGENRILVYYGMKVLAKTRRMGLVELMKLAGVKTLGSTAIGFQIGPRLNAGGRMRSAEESLKLLLAANRAEGFGAAKVLDDLNKERKKIQDEAMRTVEDEVVAGDGVIVVRGAWHEGVIGIVAGRIVERYKKPCFVFAQGEGDLMKGSGRSFGDFSLADCITNCKKMLVKGGGHNFACGVSIANERFDEFRVAVNEYYASLKLKDQMRFLKIQADMMVDSLEGLGVEEFCEELALLEPFGEGNREPIFEVGNVTVTTVGAMGSNGDHLRVTVRDKNGTVMKLVAFFAPSEWFEIEEGDKVRVMISLEVNEWRGEKAVEGRILGIEKIWSI